MRNPERPRAYERALYELVENDPDDLLRNHKLLDEPPDLSERGTAQWLALEYSVLRDLISGRRARGDDELGAFVAEIDEWTDRILARLRWADRLDELREMPYTEYLGTPEWQKTRLAALERAGNRCQTCNAASRLDVHHRAYDRLGEERDDDLIVLCRDCHTTFHRHRRLAK